MDRMQPARAFEPEPARIVDHIGEQGREAALAHAIHILPLAQPTDTVAQGAVAEAIIEVAFDIEAFPVPAHAQKQIAQIVDTKPTQLTGIDVEIAVDALHTGLLGAAAQTVCLWLPIVPA